MNVSRRQLLIGSALAAMAWPVRAQTSLRRFESFLAPGATPSAVDCGPLIAEAASWSSTTAGTVLFDGHYRIETPATVAHDGVRFQFDGASFDIADRTLTRLTNRSRLPVGIHFRQCRGLTLTGAASFVGKGRPRATRLVGVVFDDCDNVDAMAVLSFENMAAGRAAFWCRNSRFGDIHALRMIGFQPDSDYLAGTADLVGGCVSSTFGRVTARENWKPCRYLTAIPRDGALTPNVDCSFGWVDGSPALTEAGRPSPESSAIAIRSALNCRFEGCNGDGLSVGLNIVRYPTDRGLEVDGNEIGSVTGTFVGTEASVDAAILQHAQSSALPIGTTRIGRVDVQCGGEFGVFINSGRIQIDSLTVGAIGESSLVRPVAAENSEIEIGEARLSGARQEMVTIGRSASFRAGLIEIGSGSFDGATAAIRYNPAFGNGGPPRRIVIDEIVYRHGGRGKDYQYLILDQANDARLWEVRRFGGVEARRQALFRR